MIVPFLCLTVANFFKARNVYLDGPFIHLISPSILARFTIDDIIQSDWITENNVNLSDATLFGFTTRQLRILSNLEEGVHTFEIQAKDEIDVIGDWTSPKEFIIDAIPGPGILFSPRFIEYDNSITVSLENVNELLGAHIEIICKDNCATISGFTKNSELENIQEGQVSLFSDIDDTNTRLIIDLVYLGKINGLMNTLEIGRFSVARSDTGATGSIEVDADKTHFRTLYNTDITKNGLDYVKVY